MIAAWKETSVDIERDNSGRSAGREPRGYGSVLLSLSFALPVFFVVGHFTDFGRGRAAGVCTAVDVLVAMIRWRPNRELGYHCALLLMIAVQAMVIYLVPFGDDSLPAYGLVPAGVLLIRPRRDATVSVRFTSS